MSQGGTSLPHSQLPSLNGRRARGGLDMPVRLCLVAGWWWDGLQTCLSNLCSPSQGEGRLGEEKHPKPKPARWKVISLWLPCVPAYCVLCSDCT